MLFYPKTKVLPDLVGSHTAAGVLTGVLLTAAYQAETSPQTTPTKSFEIGSYPTVNFDVAYTTGAGETASRLDFKVEDSMDNINFFRLQNETVSSGTSTLADREFQHAAGAAATTYKYSLKLDSFYKWIRISFKENGVVTNFGNVYCSATVTGL